LEANCENGVEEMEENDETDANEDIFY